jgi:hypothetical protein
MLKKKGNLIKAMLLSIIPQLKTASVPWTQYIELQLLKLRKAETDETLHRVK